jgi:glycosyltransferase involved in cell wall biosynthesis
MLILPRALQPRGALRASAPSVERLLSPAVLEAWWRPKATNLLSVIYSIVLFADVPFAGTVALFAPSLVTIFGIGSLGHLLNDWYDLEADAAVGKRNRLAGLPLARKRALLLGAALIALLPWSVLPRDGVSVGLLLLELALLVAYAVPPVRLKERGVAAVLADGAYAYAVPAVLAAYTFFLAAGRSEPWVPLGTLFAWQLALGVRHFLNHLAMDRVNDLATRTPTLATRKGNRYVHALVRRVVWPAELLAFLAFMAVIGGERPALLFAVAGAFLLVSGLDLVLAVGRGHAFFTYRFSTTSVDRLYQDVLPLALLAWLTATDWRFGGLLLAHLASFHAGWRRMIAGACGALLVAPARHALASAPSRSSAGASGQIRASIAVANVNKAKYTETFIQKLIPNLDYRVYYLHGGDLPRYDDDDRAFLSNWPSLQSLAPFLEAAFRLEPGHFLRNSIAGYLQARRVRLVLAEFGPVGAQMLPITRDLGIPLVVCFHGYDVFHRETLAGWGGAYGALFREAERIIAVSDAMVSRLHELGAPRHKIVHLPAFVDLKLFPAADHSRLPPRFLAVGRFAETKSPHLTILAFHRVAQRVPGATLTLVGKGGGGELFEACVILVRSLGLEHRVEFKGVLSHDQVAAEMRAARVFVQHSVTTPENGDMEGKPVAVMEAMASGLPVVATRHPGITELIDDQLTGFLVPEYDVAAMAEAMVRLAGDDDLVRRVGRSASEHIHRHPLVGNHVRILQEIIDRAIAAG